MLDLDVKIQKLALTFHEMGKLMPVFGCAHHLSDGH